MSVLGVNMINNIASTHSQRLHRRHVTTCLHLNVIKAAGDAEYNLSTFEDAGNSGRSFFLFYLATPLTDIVDYYSSRQTNKTPPAKS
jgi:hypothetical protein